VSQAETGAPLDGRARALATRLERAAATYAHGRIYSTTDRTALAPEDVEQLEAIGYVE
jgi:hypothetical protein